MCLAAYGDTNMTDGGHHFYARCHDPTYQSGRLGLTGVTSNQSASSHVLLVKVIPRFNQSDVCIDDIFCPEDDDHHHGPHFARDDPPHCYSVIYVI